MKKLILILSLLLIFTGCRPENVNTKREYLFNAENSGLFPFYCVDNENVLWRVENKGAFSVEKEISEKSFIKYLKEKDIIIFTTAHYDKKGATFCTLMLKNGKNQPENIFDNVRLDSIRVQSDGNLLFIDEKDNLYFRRDGITTRIEGEVIQSEFVSEDTFLFRLKKAVTEDNETVYPIYYATFDYRNFLMNGADIIKTDSENGKAYIIKNKHTVQRRASAKEVADCYVYGDGEILFSVSSALLSQFEENSHMFLIAVNENSSTLKYDLYRVDGAEPVKKCENIISGRYIAKNVFAYEQQTPEEVRTYITDHTDSVYEYSLGENCSPENIYYANSQKYLLKDGELLTLGEKEIEALIDDSIEEIFVKENSLICIKEKLHPYTISVCNGTSVENKANDVYSKNVVFRNNLLYYYSNEGNQLNVVDTWGTRTALIGNIDTKVGFLCYNGTVAVLKNDTETLFIVSTSGAVDTELKINKFIMEE